MHTLTRAFTQTFYSTLGLIAILVIGLPSPALSQTKAEKMFTAALTDTQGVETEVKNLLFYWEEKVSDTAFVPHELKHIPVKRGSATINVKFDGIKTIDVKSPGEKGLPLIAISLANGNNGEFTLAIPGSFKGQSDFGETELPAANIRKIVFK